MDAAKARAIVRFVLVLVAGILAQKGVIDAPTDGQIDALSASLAAAMGGLSLAWSLYDKSREKTKVATALDMPRGSTEAELQARIETDQKVKAVRDELGK